MHQWGYLENVGRSLKEVCCLMKTLVETDADTFENEVYANAVLYVLAGCEEKYKTVESWRNFSVIKGFDPTGISGVTVGGVVKVSNASGSVSVYDVSGTLVKSVNADGGSVEIAVPGHGTYIVKVGGKTVKVAM